MQYNKTFPPNTFLKKIWNIIQKWSFFDNFGKNVVFKIFYRNGSNKKLALSLLDSTYKFAYVVKFCLIFILYFQRSNRNNFGVPYLLEKKLIFLKILDNIIFDIYLCLD